MGLFQVVVRRPGEPTLSVEIGGTPWVAGRAPGVALPLSGPGIFDRHLTLLTVPGEGLVAEVGRGALARVGEREFQRHRLRNGDEIHLGDTSLCFVLAPVQRRSLGVWTFAFWLLLALVAAAQAATFIRLVAP